SSCSGHLPPALPFRSILLPVPSLSLPELHIHPAPCLPAPPEGGPQASLRWAPADNKGRQNNRDALPAEHSPRHNRIRSGSMAPSPAARGRSSGSLPQRSSPCSRAVRNASAHQSISGILHIPPAREGPSFPLQMLSVNSSHFLHKGQYNMISGCIKPPTGKCS